MLELLTEVSNLAVPGIKPLRAVGRTRTQDVYYATDEVTGQSLAQRLDHGAMRHNDAVSLIAEAGETLGRAHLNGVVHGALHPGAVIIPAKGGDRAVQLLDFGLGPLVMAADVLPMGTRSAATPYQSPEQAKGDPFDQRADVYALGALLYEALTGRSPFAGRSALEILAHQLRGEAPSLVEFDEYFKGSPLQDVVDQSMQVEPESRFISIDAMVQALRNAGKAESTRKKPLPSAKTSKPSPASGADRSRPKPGKSKRPERKPAKKTSYRGGQKVDKESPALYYVGGAILLSTLVIGVLYGTGYIGGEPTFDDDLEPLAQVEDQLEEDPSAPSRTKTPPPRSDSPEKSGARGNTTTPRTPPRIAAQDRLPLSKRAQKLMSEGQEALREKQYSRAVTRFRSAKRAAPEAPEVARGLGLALMYAGNTGAAARELERYLELDPRASDARYIRSSIRSLAD